MFRFVAVDSVFSFNNLSRQFFKFFESEDRLPYCSVRFYALTDEFLSTVGKVESSVGDYNFHACGNGYVFSREGVYLCLSEDFESVELHCPGDVPCAAPAQYLLMLAYRYTLIANGNLLLHSAAVIHRESGIMFCGLSGAGKSTQAALWRDNLSAWAINFDQPCVIFDGETPLVHGSPWSGKEHCFINSCAPLRAIVFVEQAKKNEARLLSNAEAFSRLYLNNYVFPITEGIEAQYSENIEHLARTVPSYVLECTISEDAVKAVYSAVFGNDYNETKRKCKMTYKRKDTFILREIAGDHLIVARGPESINYGAVLVLNDSGTFLWNLLDKPVTVDDLVKALADKYSLDVELAHADVIKYIDKLVENKLVDVD